MTETALPPLLTYGVQTHPDPLQITPSGQDPTPTTLTLVVSNDTQQYIQCQSLTVSLPVGAYAKDLTLNPQSLQVSGPAGWDITQQGGQFTLTPQTPANGRLGPTSVSLTLAQIHVNAEIGTCPLAMTEVTDSGGSRSSDIPLHKFLGELTVGELDADPRVVEPGGTTTLSWSGSAGANYRLVYGEASVPDLPPVGTYTVGPLQEDTYCYLMVTAALGDTPVTFQREAHVTVEIPEVLSLQASPDMLFAGDRATLSWATKHAEYAVLSPGNVRLPPTSDPRQPYSVQPESGANVYQLTAWTSSGYPSQPRTLPIAVHPLPPPPVPVPPFLHQYPLEAITASSVQEWAQKLLGASGWPQSVEGTFNVSQQCMDSGFESAGLLAVLVSGRTTAIDCTSYIAVGGLGAGVVDVAIYPKSQSGLARYQGWNGTAWVNAPAANIGGYYWYRLVVQWSSPFHDPNAVFYAKTYRNHSVLTMPFKIWAFKGIA